MLSSVWRRPAHLWCQRESPLFSSTAEAYLLGEGLLEEMIRSTDAIELDRQRLLLLDYKGMTEPLHWDQIRQLRRAATFPVNI